MLVGCCRPSASRVEKELCGSRYFANKAISDLLFMLTLFGEFRTSTIDSFTLSVKGSSQNREYKSSFKSVLHAKGFFFHPPQSEPNASLSKRGRLANTSFCGAPFVGYEMESLTAWSFDSEWKRFLPATGWEGKGGRGVVYDSIRHLLLRHKITLREIRLWRGDCFSLCGRQGRKVAIKFTIFCGYGRLYIEWDHLLNMLVKWLLLCW